MKDPADNKTLTLLRSRNLERQAAFKTRQLELGRRQRPLWLTDAELDAVKRLLEHMRAEKP